ncbi:MAG TPA: cytochrome c family protein [Myxococcota bacterium]
MRKGLIGFTFGLGLALVMGAVDANAGDHKYVGVSKCKTCHKKELIGDQYTKWEKGPHANAYKTLKGEKAQKIAAEKGISGPANEAAECLKCHVTAYGKAPSAFASGPLKPEEGVGCESCHGPGNDYRSKKVMADHAASVAAGLWEPGKDAKVCTACHNSESPTAKPFDHAARVKEIAHPIPADVKGRYIEAEKEARAKK